MENFDVIILTLFVVVSFMVFIAGSIKEFNKMEEEPYEYKKATGPSRAALFNALKTLLEEEEESKKKEE